MASPILLCIQISAIPKFTSALAIRSICITYQWCIGLYRQVQPLMTPLHKAKDKTWRICLQEAFQTASCEETFALWVASCTTNISRLNILPENFQLGFKQVSINLIIVWFGFGLFNLLRSGFKQGSMGSIAEIATIRVWSRFS